jgi:hypothetical protein
METVMNLRSKSAVAIALFLSCSAALVSAQDKPPTYASVEDAKGSLRVPADYRERYEYLGSWSVADDDKPGAKQLHVVYASPGTRAAFKKTGEFPDGTVLVKEQFEASTDTMTSGTASHEEKLLGWFVLVKDDTNRHPGNPLRGDGWGWSHFNVGAPTRTTATDYHTDCLPCHAPAQATGWVYTQGYPSLR